ncbi:unnamed protein product [Rotaria magnacalcarata]|uniref:Uncharacterized protein n=5 Tax=Rotaria magnacalcarata TaxID=392030 RepID=A0A815AZI7_9BILA|nr:unnamed protein product [Rotaria magnacalcarata]CAF4806887.1 unnamed protein product [Rotaria magnacalcarata]
MSASSQQSLKQELTNDSATESESVDQLHQSPKESSRMVNSTPTKIPTPDKIQIEVHSQDVQANSEIPSLVNFLNCYEDKDINIPIINSEEDLKLESQQPQKEHENLHLHKQQM